MRTYKYLLLFLFSAFIGCGNDPNPFVIKNVFRTSHSLELAMPYTIHDSTSVLHRGGHPSSNRILYHLSLYRNGTQVGTITISLQEPTTKEMNTLLPPYFSVTSEFEESVCAGCSLYKSEDGTEYLLAREWKADFEHHSIAFSIVPFDNQFLPVAIASCSNAIVD